jgi:uncharacterized sulfatase
MPGLNLLDVIAQHGRTVRETVFGEVFEHNVVDNDDPARGLRDRWCVDRNWKLILPARREQPAELYDVVSDPTEQHDRAAERPEIVRKLTDEINGWWRAGG